MIAAIAGFAAGHALGQARVERLREELAIERHAARHDSLTGLPNRTVVYDLLDHNRAALVGLCDIDGLKQINDDHGHAAGDQLLRIAAARLAAAMSGAGIAARLGGDEFALLWTRPPVDAAAEASAVLDQLATPAVIGEHRLLPTASLGLAAASPNLSGRRLLSAADAAMYQAKRSRSRIQLYQDTAQP